MSTCGVHDEGVRVIAGEPTFPAAQEFLNSGGVVAAQDYRGRKALRNAKDLHLPPYFNQHSY